MATVKKCDMCGEIMSVYEENTLRTFLEYKCKSNHDGKYTDRKKKQFDLCDECTRKIVSKIPGQHPDAIIIY